MKLSRLRIAVYVRLLSYSVYSIPYFTDVVKVVVYVLNSISVAVCYLIKLSVILVVVVLRKLSVTDAYSIAVSKDVVRKAKR